MNQPACIEPIDLHIGTRIQARRIALGISQQKLGDACGTTFQQIQKYERGINRVACSRLHKLADALHVGPGYFFDGFEGTAELADSPQKDRGTLLLMAGYKALEPRVQAAIRALVQSLGESA